MINDCWKLIGVWGDRTCLELKTYTHCRNCHVYSAGGRNLLEREAPEGYLNEWTNLLAEANVEAHSLRSLKNTISVVIFRLGLEWLALPSELFKEVTPLSVIHTLPHRSNAIFLGLVNIRGEIHLCISLSALLGLETVADNSKNITNIVYKRMIVLERGGSCWVFPVDEVHNVHRFHSADLRNVPASASKSTNTYTKAMFKWQDKNVICLDDELLLFTLNNRPFEKY
ncbi:MAG TPA: chemotaxis protein CheW [Candidatus Obscuribacterales bacterium]